MGGALIADFRAVVEHWQFSKMEQTLSTGTVTVAMASQPAVQSELRNIFCLLFYPFLVQGHKAVWLWFENANGRWCCYAPEITNQIENSYQNGEQSVKYARMHTLALFTTDSEHSVLLLCLGLPQEDRGIQSSSAL